MTVTYLLLVLATAVMFGVRHATDADHVIAVSTIVSRERSLRRAGGVGVLWGAGHTLTILAAGGALILFRMSVSIHASVAFELGVGVMLMLLGVRTLTFGHRHDAAPMPLPPFAIGVVHGLAGSAAMALLIVPIIDDPLLAAAYLLAFAMGTIVGMAALTTAIAGATLHATRRIRGLDRWIRWSAGTGSLCLGVVVVARFV